MLVTSSCLSKDSECNEKGGGSQEPRGRSLMRTVHLTPVPFPGGYQKPSGFAGSYRLCDYDIEL